jgi:hypothetical protein
MRAFTGIKRRDMEGGRTYEKENTDRRRGKNVLLFNDGSWNARCVTKQATLCFMFLNRASG